MQVTYVTRFAVRDRHSTGVEVEPAVTTVQFSVSRCSVRKGCLVSLILSTPSPVLIRLRDNSLIIM